MGRAVAVLLSVAVSMSAALAATGASSAASASSASSTPGALADRDPARWVRPFIGTDGTGHVFPGATRPFGMVAPSPDHADRGWSYSGGYQWRAPRVLGFSNTHISGAGIPELGDVLLMPSAGTRWTTASTDFSAAPDRRSEHASPGHYSVRLPAHGVRVDLTATQRVAWHRYTFDRGGRVQVLVDLQHGLHFVDGPRVTASQVETDAAAGEVRGTVHARNWVERQASFVLRFSQPAERIDTLPPTAGEKAPRLLLSFAPPPGRVLEARVALSTVDVDGARGNLAATDGQRFDGVRADARREWNALLGRVQIDADARTRRIFYSALYRTMLHPSDIADADGRVRGPTGQVIAARDGRYYSTLSLWDTFRGVHPLLALLVPERVDGFVQTMLDHHRAQGYLPLWTAWGRETHTMIGNPALPVIADAVARGFRGFDRDEALQAMLQTVTAPRPQAPPWTLRDMADYDRHGYIPFDRIDNESVSVTLELGIGDDAVARVARAAGRTDISERHARRAQGYRLLWDEATRTMRGRDSQGRWRTPFDPDRATSPMNNPGDYTEANAWQYTPTPGLHDPAGLAALMGGPAGLERWLDDFFSRTSAAAGADKHLGQEALIGQYAHGNEPSHHIAWLYAWTPAPWKGQAMVHRIAKQFYGDGPDGITGNDDCGQMSAWYVLATLGLYPVVPASGEMVLGRPRVREARLQRPGAKALVIRADPPPEPSNRGGPRGPGHWASSATLDGRALDPRALRHADLAGGGRLQIGWARVP